MKGFAEVKLKLASAALLFALIATMSLPKAFADCASDKNQAVGLIQNMKSAGAANNGQVGAMSEQLAKLVDSLSSQGCNSELLDVYRTMQREGIQAN